MDKGNRPTNSAEYTPTGEPEKISYGTNNTLRFVLVIIGTVLILVGVGVIIYTFIIKPKTTGTYPVQNFEQNSQNNLNNSLDNFNSDQP